MENIEKKVRSFKTIYKMGFTKSEIENLLKEFPGINMDKFNAALNFNTCMMEGDEIILYHCDIEKALYCGLENRNLRSSEFD